MVTAFLPRPATDKPDRSSLSGSASRVRVANSSRQRLLEALQGFEGFRGSTEREFVGHFLHIDAKASDDSGLIDITESRTTKHSKRPVIESDTTESGSPGTDSESSLIAARVAQTVWQGQRRTALSAPAVPSIFATTADGGFIELIAMATDRNPATRGEKPLKTLTRHDQVDAELGHFVGFEGADIFGSSALSIAIPKRIAPTDSPDTTDFHAASSTNRLSWGLLLSAGTALALWRTPVRTRRMAQTWLRSLGTRCRQAVRVFTAR